MTPPRAEWRVAHPTAWPALPSLEGRIEPGIDAFPVHVTIVQGGVTTGWDDGALGFDEEALWFSGQATSFRLIAADIQRLDGQASLSEPLGISTHLELVLHHRRRRVLLKVRFLTDGPRHAAENRDIARDRLARLPGWSRETSQYPPLTPRPGLLPSKAVSRRYGVAYLALIVLFVACLAARASFALPLFVAAAGALNHFTRLFEVPRLERIAREEGE